MVHFGANHVNDIIDQFNIQFGGNSPDNSTGGSTKPNEVTSDQLKITYHASRIVMGGTPFCFNNHSEEYPFGSYQELKNGGKIVVMGDAMVSLYMTTWEGVTDYQCQEFMQDVFRWLLE